MLVEAGRQASGVELAAGLVCAARREGVPREPIMSDAMKANRAILFIEKPSFSVI